MKPLGLIWLMVVIVDDN